MTESRSPGVPEFFLWDIEELTFLKTLRLRNFSFFLSSTFIYEPILIEISLNANIIKTHFFFIKLKVTKGHHKILKSSISAINFLFNAWCLKFFKNVNIMKTQLFFLKLSMTSRSSKVIYGHFCAKILIEHSFMKRFWSMFVWMLTSFFHKVIYDSWNVTFMLWSSFVLYFLL